MICVGVVHTWETLNAVAIGTVSNRAIDAGGEVYIPVFARWTVCYAGVVW